MQHAEVHHHALEARVLERKGLGVAYAELDPRVQRAGPPDHRWGEVESRHRRPDAMRRRGHDAGAAAQIEDALPGAHVRRREQRPRELR